MPHDAPARTPPDRLPGLDGLRALAVVAVLLFHLHAAWLPGGFLGVDVFFVISGFLITTLLVREHARTGRVDLRGFWLRRARRLLPALLLVVVGSTLAARLVEGDLLVGIARQTLGALTFSTNWLEIAAGSDYFHATSPQLLMNLWSLAVEEQFYLLWPVMVLLLVRVVRRRRRRLLLPLALGLGSAVLMATRLDPLAPTRVYYGTDTHLVGLMLGAALAFAYAAPHRAWTRTPAWGHLRRPLTAWSLVVLFTLMVLAREDSAFTFRAGIPLAALATAVLVLRVVSSPGRLREVCTARPVVWVGERSYGIYLWHWPVILVLGALWPIAPGGAAFVASRVLCVVMTLALAEASHRWVETPVRRLGFRGSLLALRAHLDGLTPRGLRWATAMAVLAVLAYGAVVAGAPRQTTTEATLAANAARQTGTATGQDAPAPAGATTPTDLESHVPAIAMTPPTDAEKATVFAMPAGDEIDAYGDSMLVGSYPAMRYYFPGIRLDGRSNRHWSDGVVAVRAKAGANRRAVVLAFGTNAGVDKDAIDAALTALGPQRMVVLVTEHGAFSRATEDNAVLHAVAAAHENVIVADWDAALAGTTGQLQPDGIHPSRVGQHLFAKTIRTALAELSTRHTGVVPELPELPIP